MNIKNLKVIKVNSDSLEFNDGFKLTSDHRQDCCEVHYLSFSDLTIEDFKGLEFDLRDDKFFKSISGYGIELIPIKGHSVKIPGYGVNNGYYSDELLLIITGKNNFKMTFDITDCQIVKG